MTLPASASDRFHLLMAVLTWLVPRRSALIDDCARRFDLSPADVVSLIEMAACCGVPPYTPDSLLELYVDGERVEANLGSLLARARRFTPAEGFAVAASCRAILEVPGADPDGALRRALGKLEKALGEREGSSVAVDLDSPPFLGEVRRAIENRRQVDIEYYSASRDEVTTRCIEPFELFAVSGRWYVDAFCHLAGGVRHFRVDRIRRLSDAGRPFVSIAGSDDRRVHPDFFDEAPEVTVEVPAASRGVFDSFPTRSIEDAGNGRIRVVLPVAGLPFLERLLLVLGSGASVVSPEEWADVGRRCALRIRRRYDAELSGQHG